jgi:hypothetical protein
MLDRPTSRPLGLALGLLAGLGLAVAVTTPAPAQTAGRPSSPKSSPTKGLTIDPSTPVQKASSPIGRPNRLPRLLSLGERMANYLQEQVNARRRIGGGECAHLATEALRIAGAEFRRTEPSGTEDYVWTSNRVARLTRGSQLAYRRFQVGDVIQYHNATFSVGGNLPHHTQVVAAVSSLGRITQVYEQNVGVGRIAQRRAAPDLTKLTGGSVSIYRPVARARRAGYVEYTLVNNTSISRTLTNPSGVTLTRANTVGSYQDRWVTFSGTARPTLKIASTSLVIEDGAAYELFSLPGGQAGIRRM